MADTPKHSVSVAGIVVDDHDRILVIQRRDNGHWEPPGGVLELAESPQEGTRREVLEETGIDSEVLDLSGVYKNLSRGIISLVFRCRPLTRSAPFTDEANAVCWFSEEEVRRLMTPAYAVRVTDALLPGVQVRVHDGTNLVAGNDEAVKSR